MLQSWKWSRSILLLVLAFSWVAFTGCKQSSQDKITEETVVEIPQETPPADVPVVEENSATDSSFQTGKINVIVGEESYNSFIAAAPVTVVDFSAVWCGPCQKLKPTLEKMASVYAPQGVMFAQVDVDANRATVEQLGIQGIPDVRIFVNGIQKFQTVGLRPQEIFANVEDALQGVAAAPAAPAQEAPAE